MYQIICFIKKILKNKLIKLKDIPTVKSADADKFTDSTE